MSSELLLVCTACGSPWCWAGDYMCEDYLRASSAPCSCEWMLDRSGPVGDSPLIIDPCCIAHGEVP